MSFNHYEKYHLHDNVIKKGTCYDKQEIDNQKVALKTEINELVKSSIQTALNKFSTDLFKFINNRMKGRVGKKTLTIPKTNYTWIKLLDASEIDGITTLEEIIIQNMYIKRTDRYHHAKSSHTANAFTNFSAYYCYFDAHPSSWSMDCILEYVKIPKKISVEDSGEEANE